MLPDDELLGGGEDSLLGPGQAGGGKNNNSKHRGEHPAGRGRLGQDWIGDSIARLDE